MTYALYYGYDEAGAISHVTVKSGTASATFYYVKNLQGDVVAITDSNGTVLVQYKYDAWGEVYNYSTASGLTGLSQYIAYNNPFRYRGYYYDTETGFYYLNSRYYDPEVGRFLNVDSALYHSMQGYNMYAYCYNNPVMYHDPYGANGEAVIQGIFSGWVSIGGAAACAEPTFIGEIVYIVGIGVIGIICLSMSGSEPVTKDEGVVAPETPKSEETVDVPDIEYPGDDPTVAPGEDYEWHGKKGEPVGSDKGAWVNKNTGEKWHPDLNHPLPKGPHWDYTGPDGVTWYINSKGEIKIW